MSHDLGSAARSCIDSTAVQLLGCCSDVGALLGYLRPAAPYVMPIAASALTFGLGLQATQVRPIFHQSQASQV